MLQVGDIVRCTKTYMNRYEALEKIGVVLKVDRFDPPRYGIEFFENIRGHDLNGSCKVGHGWFMPESCLELVDDTPQEVSFTMDYSDLF